MGAPAGSHGAHARHHLLRPAAHVRRPRPGRGCRNLILAHQGHAGLSSPGMAPTRCRPSPSVSWVRWSPRLGTRATRWDLKIWRPGLCRRGPHLCPGNRRPGRQNPRGSWPSGAGRGMPAAMSDPRRPGRPVAPPALSPGQAGGGRPGGGGCPPRVDPGSCTNSIRRYFANACARQTFAAAAR